MLTLSIASTDSGKSVRISMFITAHALQDPDLHPVGIQVHRPDEYLRHGGNQVFLSAPDGVDLMGGISIHADQLAQKRTAVGVVYGKPSSSSSK